MGPTLFCVLLLFLLNTLLNCGHTEDAELTVEPNSPYLFTGESVTFMCDMREGTDTDWLYTFNRNGQPVVSFSTNNLYSLDLTADLSGDYQCTGRHKGSKNLTKQSKNVTLSVSARRPVATLRAGRTTIPAGGTLTLTCSVEGSAGWKYHWFRRTSDSHETLIADGVQNISISQSGIYWCQGGRGKPVFLTEFSDEFRAEITLSKGISVTLQHNWTKVFSGEMITVVCKIETRGVTKWMYEWRTTSSHTPPTHSEYRIGSASLSHSGLYWCKGRRDSYSSTEWSNAFQLIVSSYRSRPRVTAQKGTIPEGGNEILTCHMEDSAEWKYYWFRRSSVFSESQIIGDGKPETVISISQGGIYHCRGGRGNPVVFTEDSDAVTIEKRVSSKAVATLQPNWPLIFSGETITVSCDIHERGNTAWEYEWSKPNSNATLTDNKCRISSATVSNSGNYRCMGKKKWDSYSSTEWSDVITLTVSSHKPNANLRADRTAIPAGGSVTLTCSVNPPSFGWKYLWFREETTFQYLTTQEFVPLSNGQILVSQEGLYMCIGGRGDPIYYTGYSESVSINKIAANGSVVTMQPNWPELCSGETVTLRCETQGGDTKWEYEWMTTSSVQPPNQKEYRISSVSPSHSGDYWCKGRLERAQQNSAGWSISFKLTASYNKPRPVLTVSPSWLSPGASVTLNCIVEHPSAGWRFFWYKTVPKPLDDSYSYELLPGSINGTEQDSYIVDGQTHTAGYVCRAGRGDPVYYTDYSKPKFVWSEDVHSAASLTVSPDRVQHFLYDSISLSCEGNSTEWRVKASDDGDLLHLPYCSRWGTMTGFTCSIGSHRPLFRTAVFWCESGSGEFSNAVNITIHDDIILVSPVHPVTEGDSVTLGCKLRTEELLSSVTFYKNDELIQNNDRVDLNISAVSKSDEGFYKCKYSGKVSPPCWMSVKSSGSPFPVRLIAGLVCGITLIVLLPLLLLCWCKKSEDTCCCRLIQSQRTNQSSATVQTVNQGENQQQIYSSLLHGDVCVYEAVVGSGNTGSGDCADDYRNVTSQIQLKSLGRRRMCDDAVESSDYYNVNPDSIAGP